MNAIRMVAKVKKKKEQQDEDELDWSEVCKPRPAKVRRKTGGRGKYKHHATATSEDPGTEAKSIEQLVHRDLTDAIVAKCESVTLRE